MAGFWELPSVEQLPGVRLGEPVGAFRHTITHHHYRVTVWTARVSRPPKPLQWVARDELDRLALSTVARKALRLAGSR